MKQIYGLRFTACRLGKISLRLFGVLFILSVLFSACSTINPVDPIPAYIRIESIGLTTNKATQGAATHNIKDAWVFVDGQVIGVFEMPVNVPVLYSGLHTVVIRAGIIVNGIAATRTDYVFYTALTQTMDLEPGKVDTINPTVTYNNAGFSQLEDFDQSGTVFIKTSQSADSLHIITDSTICLPGNGKCGASLLNASRQSFEFISVDSFPMPIGSVKYMELDFKSDYEFTIGLQSFTSFTAYKDDILILKPSSKWQKIYVNLNAASDMNPNATYFKVYMRTVLNTSVQSSANIYFDNIKVIHNG